MSKIIRHCQSKGKKKFGRISDYEFEFNSSFRDKEVDLKGLNSLNSNIVLAFKHSLNFQV